MGCAPSKQSAEDDIDPDQRPLEANDKKSPKNKKAPRKGKGHKEQNDDKLANNNAKDEAIQEEKIQPVESAPNNVTAPSTDQTEQEVQETDIDTIVPEHSQVIAASPTSPTHKQRGDLWDLSKGMPPPTSPYDNIDGETSPPPKPPRHVNWDQQNGAEQGKDNYHTFPRRQKARPFSAREKYLEEGSKSSTLERKLSLRERTPERRKDLDVSGNIYMGKMLELPGRGKVIPTDKVDFLNPAEIDVVHVEDTKDATLPRGSVKEIANAFLELTKKKEEELKPKTPIKHVHVKKAGSSSASDDALGDDWEIVEAGEGDLSVIETVNKQILEEYKAVERKNFEQIEEERLARVAEEERIQAELEAKRLAEEAERIRAEEAERICIEEAEKIRAEEAERIRAEEAERIRAEEENQRLAEEAEIERIRAEQNQQEEFAGAEGNNQQEEECSPGEQGDDPAVTGTAHEDRLYNNKAFDKPDIDSSDPQQQDAALKIQTKYRQHHAKEAVSKKREEVAVVKIQAGYRGWHDRKRVNNIRAEADCQSQKAAAEAEQEDAEAAERGDINLDDPEVEAAATKIQAGFKGYKARQQVQSIKDQKAQSESQPEEDDAQNAINYDDPEVVGAATKIQAGFRGYQTRKDMTAVKGGHDTSLPPTGDEHQAENAEPTDQTVDKSHDDLAELNIDPENVDDTAAEAEPVDEINETVDQNETQVEADQKEQVTNELEQNEQDQHEVEENQREVGDQNEAEGASREAAIVELTEADQQGETTDAATNLEGPEDAPQESTDEAPQESTDEAPQEPTDEAPQESTVETTEDQPQINLDDPEANFAASKIQAGFKGMKTRKEVKAKREAQIGQPGDTTDTDNAQSADAPATDAPAANDTAADAPAADDPAEGGTEIDIDLNDPEVSKAATKIQASFKGYMVRKEQASSENISEENQQETTQDSSQAEGGQTDAGQTDGAAETSESPTPQNQNQVATDNNTQ